MHFYIAWNQLIRFWNSLLTQNSRINRQTSEQMASQCFLNVIKTHSAIFQYYLGYSFHKLTRMQCFIQHVNLTRTFFGPVFFLPSPSFTAVSEWQHWSRISCRDDPTGARVQQGFNQVKSCPSIETPFNLSSPKFRFIFFFFFRSHNVTSSECSEFNVFCEMINCQWRY
jgi:hypothetical protein